jgi:hypothetical protein
MIVKPAPTSRSGSPVMSLATAPSRAPRSSKIRRSYPPYSDTVRIVGEQPPRGMAPWFPSVPLYADARIDFG